MQYCGSTCEKNDDCPSKCPCNEGTCKNDDSVSCSGFTCPTGKLNRLNTLCEGKIDTCTEEDCCASPLSPPSSPSSGSGTPKSDDNILSISLIVLGCVLILVGLILFIYNFYYNVKNKNTLSLSIQNGGNKKNIIGLVIGIILMVSGCIPLYFGIDLYQDSKKDDEYE